MKNGTGQGRLSLACVRSGDLLFYAGPARMQALLQAFGLPWGHVGVIINRDGRFHVVEMGFEGTRTKRLDVVYRHYGAVGIGRLPVIDEIAEELASAAETQLDANRVYGNRLAKLQYYWSNMRCVESKRTQLLCKLAMPLVAVTAAWLSRQKRTTCSSLVHDLLVQTNLDATLNLRFDLTLPERPTSAWRWHHRFAGALCSPSDLWLAPRLKTHKHVSDL